MTRILILEENNCLSGSIKNVLKDNGYESVELVETKKQTLELIENNLVDIAMIVIPIGENGEMFGFLESIKTQHQIPLVLCFENLTMHAYEVMASLKPAGYLIKPFKNDKLLSIIKDVCQKDHDNNFGQKTLKEKVFPEVYKALDKRKFHFVAPYLSDRDKTLVLSESNYTQIESEPKSTYDVIINLIKTNNLRRINKYLESVNEKLPNGGYYIGYAETKGLRKKMIFTKYPIGFNYLYYFFYFIIKRVWPKLPGLRKLYFLITKGRNRAMSRAEVLGRLISCGFKIIDEGYIESDFYFIAQKIRAPYFDMKASYDLIFKMKRVGKYGKPIYVYKFRTMYPYSEYIQDYILKRYGYGENGKPARDFRLTRWGRFLRRYWLDELPQIINVLKGEMKIVGIRPVSERFLKEYPEDVKKMRMKYKPGCVPPYVALIKQEINEYIESERIYFKEKEKNPYTTDIKYFFKAIYNIVTHKIKSA